jgi:branched-chain amino acid aminotransferase
MSFEEMDVDTIWQDGEFVDWDEAQTHVLTHSLHYGTAVFEGVRCYDTVDGPAVFRWDEHLDRLFDSAKVLGLDIQHSRETLTEATRTLIREQELHSCYIRPLVYYGYDQLGVSPEGCPTETIVACWPWGAYLGEDAIENGVDVMVSSWRKHASSQIPTNVKATGPYLNSMLAGGEARRNGYVEAIVLNKEGKVAEGPGENVFMINDGELYTTGLAESILDGITRNTVIRLARDLSSSTSWRANSAATTSGSTTSDRVVCNSLPPCRHRHRASAREAPDGVTLAENDHARLYDTSVHARPALSTLTGTAGTSAVPMSRRATLPGRPPERSGGTRKPGGPTPKSVYPCRRFLRVCRCA